MDKLIVEKKVVEVYGNGGIVVHSDENVLTEIIRVLVEKGVDFTVLHRGEVEGTNVVRRCVKGAHETHVYDKDGNELEAHR